MAGMRLVAWMGALALLGCPNSGGGGSGTGTGSGGAGGSAEQAAPSTPPGPGPAPAGEERSSPPSTPAPAPGTEPAAPAPRGPTAATLTLNSAEGTPVLRLSARTPGAAANDALAVTVTHNRTQSYNLLVLWQGAQAEEYVGLTNSTIVSRLEQGSNKVTAELLPGASNAFPAAVEARAFSGGEDGAPAQGGPAAGPSSPSGGQDISALAARGGRFSARFAGMGGSAAAGDQMILSEGGQSVVVIVPPALMDRLELTGVLARLTPGTAVVVETRAQASGPPHVTSLRLQE